MKSNYNYKFYGDLNLYYRHKYLTGLLLLIVFIFMPISFIFGVIGFLISFILVISTLIFILNKFNHENNLILFTDEQIIYLKKDFISEIKYEDVTKIERVYQPKGLTLHELKTNNQTFKFNISIKVNTISPYSSFYELILNKNKNIEIIEIVFCDKHKYFLHHGEVKKVQID